MAKGGNRIKPENMQAAKYKADETKRTFHIAIQEGLNTVLTSKWIRYEEMHRLLNQYMTVRLKKKVDLEFSTIGEHLGKLSKKKPIEWRQERVGYHSSEHIIYLRLV
jgi:hypothetical protein